MITKPSGGEDIFVFALSFFTINGSSFFFRLADKLPFCMNEKNNCLVTWFLQGETTRERQRDSERQ